MFHNYNSMISRHQRKFTIAHKIENETDPDTGHSMDLSYSTAVNVSGVFWNITNKELKRYPELELSLSDMKIITTTNLLNGFVPELKDRVVYIGNNYYIKHMIDQTYYGNYKILYLTKEQLKI